jgi:8-oxo-dGTP pyrophosphatase MutT (NUDIX family)
VLSFDPNREPVVPKPAATVIVAREHEKGPLEIFCVKRHAASGFMGGALVFPGGKLSPADARPEWVALSNGVSERVARLGSDANEARAFAIAALRELVEEAAILPVAGAPLDDDRVLAFRAELEARVKGGADGADAFLELCTAEGLMLDSNRLHAFARWVTPLAEQRRYDTRFYLLGLTEAQTGRHDEHETTHSFWATPDDVLERWERLEVFLAPPTVRVLELLSGATSIASAAEVATAQSLSPICPFAVLEGDDVILALPGDPLFNDKEAIAAPGAPTRFVMRNGRFLPERA